MAEWTTTPPTVEGWYWLMESDGKPQIVRVALEYKIGSLREQVWTVWFSGWDHPDQTLQPCRYRHWWPIAIKPPPLDPAAFRCEPPPGHEHNPDPDYDHWSCRHCGHVDMRGGSSPCPELMAQALGLPDL